MNIYVKSGLQTAAILLVVFGLVSLADMAAGQIAPVAPTCAPTQIVETIIRNERPKMGDLERKFWLNAITKAAAEAGAPPVVFASQVAQESRFKGHVVSHKGAKGAAQIMDVWLKEYKGVDLMEIEANLALGAKILVHYTDKCGGIEGGLRCYAAGPKNQRAAQWYADRVLARVALAATGACAVPGTEIKKA